MDKELDSSENLNPEFDNQNNSNNYQNLIQRLNSIKETITLLENNMFFK